MMSTVEEKTLTINVKTEANLDNAFLSETEYPVGEQTTYANIKCKEEINDEGPSEILTTFLTENQQNIAVKQEVDQIDVSETILQSSHYNLKLKKENDSENQKAFTQSNSPKDDHKGKKYRATKRSNSINAKKAKIKNCQFCNTFFTTKRSLDDHILKHHKQEIKGDLKSLITSKIYTCNMCNSYETIKKLDIDRHVNSVHNEVKFKIKCQFCSKSFFFKTLLDGHVLKKHRDEIKNNFKRFITSKIHVCKICNCYETTLKAQLDRHINSVHNNVKFKIECQFCKESFVCKRSLDGHVLKNHKDEIKDNFKSFITSTIHVCKICNSYETTRNSNLNKHINSVHNKVKIKIDCQFCTKSFKCKRTLDLHVLRNHKDEIKDNFKSFITSTIHVCKICNSYVTTDKSQLHRHINVIHNKVKFKMKCEFCTKSFIYKGSLEGHVLNKHKER